MVGGGVSATCYRPYQNCRDLSSFMKLSFIVHNIQLTSVYTHIQTHREGKRLFTDTSRKTFQRYASNRTVRPLRGRLLAVSHTAHSAFYTGKKKFNQFEVGMPPVKVKSC